MNRTLKTLLIWLLMAVVPLNAVAAAFGTSCDHMHQNLPQLSQHGEGSGPEASETISHHQHDDAALAASEPKATHDVAVSGKKTAQSCSACSPFCIGAVAPPPASIAPAPLAGSETVVPSPTPVIACFIPDAHKRPPRHLSA